MSHRFQNVLIQLDSSLANSYHNSYNTNFTTNFDSVSCQSSESIVYSLIPAQIPYSFYGVNQYNYVLDLEEKINGNTSTRRIFLEQGNFNAYDFATMFKNCINTNSITYQILYDKHVNRYFINITTNNCSAIFKFNTGHQHNCHNLLGFELTDVNISLYITTSTKCIVMSEIANIFVKTDLGANVLLQSSLDRANY